MILEWWAGRAHVSYILRHSHIPVHRIGIDKSDRTISPGAKLEIPKEFPQGECQDRHSSTDLDGVSRPQGESQGWLSSAYDRFK